jgi:hypothetical protein
MFYEFKEPVCISFSLSIRSSVSLVGPSVCHLLFPPHPFCLSVHMSCLLSVRLINLSDREMEILQSLDWSRLSFESLLSVVADLQWRRRPNLCKKFLTNLYFL